MAMSAEGLGLYVSVPFCRAKCSFCNFASGVSSAEAIERYVEQLCAELRGVRAEARRAAAWLPDAVKTVYFGGGTPSLLRPQQLRRIFAAIRAEFAVDQMAEITLEAAPGQIGDGLLEAGLAEGVNRVSLGVQSFVDRESQAVGRSHTGAGCRAEFERLRRTGVTNLGADLIAGLPYQNATSWSESLEAAVESGLDHLSVYMLEVDEDSRLGREVLGGGARLHAPAVPSDDVMAELYEEVCAWLPAHGLEQYEISNFARPGASARHNEKYWTRAPYLGVGLDAHSMLRGDKGVLRWANPEELLGYAGCSGMEAGAWLTQREAFEETVFLGLRLVRGLPWQQLEAFPVAWVAALRESVRGMAGEGLMGMDAGSLWLTAGGRLVSGEIFGELLAGAAALAA